MTTTRRNVLWPVLIMVVGGIWLLRVADAFPDAVDDILTRAWPVLLVLFGFDVLFGRRRRLWRWRVETSLIGLVMALLLLAGVVWFAYQKQANVVRADNIQTFSETLSEGVERVQLSIAVERTRITIKPAEDHPRQLGVTFQGSRESEVELVWSSEGNTGILTVKETHRNAIPKLEDYGRGTLEVVLPTSVIIDQFDLSGEQGDVILDLRPVHMRQILLVVEQGDIQLTLPAFDVLQGDLKAREGSIELLVPAGRALDVKLSAGSGTPQYNLDKDKYDVLYDGEIKPANTTAFQYALNVWLKKDAWFIITDLE